MGVWDANLPTFIAKLLCFWKGLLDRVASCNPRRMDPQAHDAGSNGAEVNHLKPGQP